MWHSLRRNLTLPVYVKGVQSEEDVARALDAGAQGIWVSNHGGRQLDGGPAAFDSLQIVADAVAGRVPIVFDSGLAAVGSTSLKQSPLNC